jgi:hypothetical protein
VEHRLDPTRFNYTMATRRRKGAASSSSAGSTSKRSRKTLDLGWNGDDNNGGDDKDGNNENIYSEDDSDDNEQRRGESSRQGESDSDEEEEEALDAKKVRLAREYLEKIDAASDDSSATGEDSDSGDDDGGDRVGRKLQRDRMKREGTLERAIADKLATSVASLHATVRAAAAATAATTKTPPSVTSTEKVVAKAWEDAGHVQLCRGHDLTVTCVALQADGSKAVSDPKTIPSCCGTWRKERTWHTFVRTGERQTSTGLAVKYWPWRVRTMVATPPWERETRPSVSLTFGPAATVDKIPISYTNLRDTREPLPVLPFEHNPCSSFRPVRIAVYDIII